MTEPLHAAFILAFLATLPLLLMCLPVPNNCPTRCSCTDKYVRCRNLNLTCVPDIEDAELVELLDISFNSLQHLTENAFTKYPNVKELNARYNKINKLYPEAFRGLKSLTKVDLSLNYIEHINPRTFMYCVLLQTVILSKNPLVTSSPHDPILIAPSVTSLFLSSCMLNELSREFFSNLSSLQTLDLSSNKLTELSLDFFTPLTNLTSLELHDNPWACTRNTKDLMCWAASRRTEEKTPRAVYCSDAQMNRRKLSESLNKNCTPQHNETTTFSPSTIRTGVSITPTRSSEYGAMKTSTTLSWNDHSDKARTKDSELLKMGQVKLIVIAALIFAVAIFLSLLAIHYVTVRIKFFNPDRDDSDTE